MPSGDELTDIETTFSEVAIALFAAGSVQGTLDKIVELAVVAVERCQDAGILAAGDGEAPTTLAASSPLAVMLDQLQLDAGGGPCLDSAHSGSTIYVEDLVGDRRWPEFAAPAVDAGIRSVLGYALATETPGALNLYASVPDAFGPHDRAQALLFATLARLALETAQERDVDAARTVNLTEALRTRELIGQAQGILIEREHITGEQAFEVLRRASQHLNVKLREVAATLVETGEHPDTGNGETTGAPPPPDRGERPHRP